MSKHWHMIWLNSFPLRGSGIISFKFKECNKRVVFCINSQCACGESEFKDICHASCVLNALNLSKQSRTFCTRLFYRDQLLHFLKSWCFDSEINATCSDWHCTELTVTFQGFGDNTFQQKWVKLIFHIIHDYTKETV